MSDIELQQRGCPTTGGPVAEPGAAADPAAFVRAEEDGMSRLELLVRGAKCAGCISKIEGGVTALAGVRDARLNLSTGKLSVSWKQQDADPGQIAKKVADMGYQVSPYDPGEAEEERDKEGRFLLVCLAVAGFALMNIMLFSISVWSGDSGEMNQTTRLFFHWISALIALPAAAFAGRPFFSSAFRSLQKGQANMDVPISLAVLLALGLSLYETAVGGGHTYFDAAVMLLFFLLIGRWLDHRLRGATRVAARKLLSLQANTANVLASNGEITAVRSNQIKPGDTIILWPGDRAPVDGVITEGKSDIDMALVSGESAPALVQTGEPVKAGMINLTAKLIMQATATSADSLLAELTRLVEAGEAAKGRFVRLADRAARLYVPVVHSLALLAFVGWMMSGAGVHQSIVIAAAVLIITCPCALGLAAPAVQIVAVGRLFKQGVLVKTGDALERLAQIDMVLFDKTGTLTLGKPELLNRAELSQQTIARAALLARTSRHPLSQAIANLAGPGPVATDTREVPGYGVEGKIDGQMVRLGKREWVLDETDAGNAEIASSQLYLAGAGETPIVFLFADALRVDANQSVTALKQLGIKVAMLSGDRKQPALAAAKLAGIDEVYYQLTPQQKIDHVDKMGSDGHKVLMVGDGLNDAPALAAAHVSMSPASAADASQAAADIVIDGSKLMPVVQAIHTAKAAKFRILQNFGLAAFYNMFAVPMALFGFVTPMIAAIAMSGSSIFVTLNALRKFRKGG
ncbi:Type cbb3 cytochrome oxidase biogenesis protein CcoI; Copper-translocating P-type ATPase [hydrothermal vent metagenome]|uniref:Type cbb3 cytochrome oxidase biogenesis protein CcoI Copper-translocating P-type ATPase n=1 Tax=hydrothermal vent metagenome TaxID=652676 RepID=A0A3B0RGS0_9ZZZZ